MPFDKIFFILLSFSLLAGCRNDQREQQLIQREQALTDKEKKFTMKEADYYALLKMRDSLLTKKDTVIVQQWPQEVSGLWNARSICRESNCSEYIIGDQRTNVWEFISDSTGLHTRVFDKNNKLVRVYDARFDSTSINLQFLSDSLASKKMNLAIDLSTVSSELIKGTQTIKTDQSCTAKFSIELTRSTNR
jgi:hypothetical protein